MSDALLTSTGVGGRHKRGLRRQRTTSLLDGVQANEESSAVIAKMTLPVLDEDDGERPFSLQELQRSVKDQCMR